MTDTETLSDIPHLGPISIKKLETIGVTTKRLLYTELTESSLMNITDRDWETMALSVFVVL